MQSEKWIHRDVDENGAVLTGGAVHAEFRVSNSIEDPCTLEGCKCRRCHWISVNLGRQDDACVYGVSYYFKTEKELLHFILDN